MMTSRAEYRLLLRQDNADLRLRSIGYRAGLVTKEQYEYVTWKEQKIAEEVNRLKTTSVGANKVVQNYLESQNSALLKTGTFLSELMCRPELSYENTREIDPERPELTADIIEQVNINIKYDGYISRQMKQVEQFKKIENKKIPEEIDYEAIGNLRMEARQKLKKFRPVSVGQASRIGGVSPADISVLLIYLEQFYQNNRNM